MNEKQFELYSDDYFFGAYDNVTQEKINVLKSIDLLNSLVEENEQLRQQMEIENKWQLEKDRYYVQLQEENEYLKKENARFKQMLENLGYKVVISDE